MSTFVDLVERRIAADRVVAVHVVGDAAKYPSEGLATARRVADLIAGDNDVVDLFEDEVTRPEPGTVLFASVRDPERRHQWETLAAIIKSLHTRRVRQCHHVVHASTVPKQIEHVLDARVRIDPVRCYKIKRDLYSGDVYEVTLGGLVAE